MNVKVTMDNSQKILLKRSLNKNGKAQIHFTKILEKEMNNYVPFLTGRLKDGNVIIKTDKIIYHAPYAQKQYYTNRGFGRDGTSVGGLRGKLWDKRCWINKGDKIVEDVAKKCGGRSK